jgi:hypothetical protein
VDDSWSIDSEATELKPMSSTKMGRCPEIRQSISQTRRNLASRKSSASSDLFEDCSYKPWAIPQKSKNWEASYPPHDGRDLANHFCIAVIAKFLSQSQVLRIGMDEQ